MVRTPTIFFYRFLPQKIGTQNLANRKRPTHGKFFQNIKNARGRGGTG